MIKKIMKNKDNKVGKSDLKPGRLYTYAYDAKDKSQTYDQTPLVFVLRTSARHLLCVNFHWAPQPLKVVLAKFFFNMNRTNIKQGKPLELDYKTIKPFLKKIGFAPIIRRYIRARISRYIIRIPDSDFMNIVMSRSESFTQGKVSAEQLYKLALKRNKQYRSTRKRRE